MGESQRSLQFSTGENSGAGTRFERSKQCFETKWRSLNECEEELNTIDDRVKQLKNVFKEKTREAEVLKQHLEKTNETLDKAKTDGKLSGEVALTTRCQNCRDRWHPSVTNPIAAGFNTYLAKKPEDARKDASNGLIYAKLIPKPSIIGAWCQVKGAIV